MRELVLRSVMDMPESTVSSLGGVEGTGKLLVVMVPKGVVNLTLIDEPLAQGDPSELEYPTEKTAGNKEFATIALPPLFTTQVLGDAVTTIELPVGTLFALIKFPSETLKVKLLVV